ncbi:MAG: nitroreductase family protein [Armatimonadetes bacterium]|nr:nitroreductase family protein [Armatimonadota bacterium]
MFDESSDRAWRSRYGSEPPSDLGVEGRFLAHRSVREYSDRQITEGVVHGLVAAAQSAATSSNLQLWSVVTVQNPERRQAVAALCADQSQIHDASWFLCFLVDHYRLRRIGRAVGEECLGLDYNEFYTMALIDAALAAERLVCAAESVGVGICYIGALRNDPVAVAELLGLPDGVFGAFGLCLGYPAEGVQAHIKPRLAQDKVWFRERYDLDVEVGDYDERMQSFYDSQNMKVDVTWSKRSGRRVDEHHLSGREAQKEFLERQGICRR